MGFIRCCLDESREALAGLLRPGNADANTASDHVDVVDLGLEQLPRNVIEDAEIVVRTDSAGPSHELTDELCAAQINFLIGLDLTEPVRQAILSRAEIRVAAGDPPRGDGREGAWWPRSRACWT